MDCWNAIYGASSAVGILERDYVGSGLESVNRLYSIVNGSCSHGVLIWVFILSCGVWVILFLSGDNRLGQMIVDNWKNWVSGGERVDCSWRSVGEGSIGVFLLWWFFNNLRLWWSDGWDAIFVVSSFLSMSNSCWSERQLLAWPIFRSGSISVFSSNSINGSSISVEMFCWNFLNCVGVGVESWNSVFGSCCGGNEGQRNCIGWSGNSLYCWYSIISWSNCVRVCHWNVKSSGAVLVICYNSVLSSGEWTTVPDWIEAWGNCTISNRGYWNIGRYRCSIYWSGNWLRWVINNWFGASTCVFAWATAVFSFNNNVLEIEI